MFQIVVQTLAVTGAFNRIKNDTHMYTPPAVLLFLLVTEIHMIRRFNDLHRCYDRGHITLLLPVALYQLSVEVAGSYNYSLLWPPCMQLAIKPAVLIYIFCQQCSFKKKHNSDQE